jgi:hypothetical protein
LPECQNPAIARPIGCGYSGDEPMVDVTSIAPLWYSRHAARSQAKAADTVGGATAPARFAHSSMPRRAMRLFAAAIVSAALLIGCGEQVDAVDPAAEGEALAKAQHSAPASQMAVTDPVQWCLMQSTPPGMQWKPELLEALCADHFAQVPDAATYKQLIDAKDWPRLRAMHDHYLARHHDGQDPEYLLYRLYPRAGWSKPGEAEAYARRWQRAVPKDPFANYVRGRQVLDRALDARGDWPQAKLPPAKLKALRALAREAASLLRRAIAAEQRLIPAYTLMIDAYALAGQHASVDIALESALKRAPQSYYPRARAVHYSHGKWGGSSSRVAAIIKEGGSWSGRNPRMTLLQSMVDFHRGDANFQHALWEKAYRRQRELLARAPLYGALMQTGRCAAEMNRHAEAAEYYTHAMRFTDNPGQALISRGVAMERMGDYASALNDYLASQPYEPSRKDIAQRAATLEKHFKRGKKAT